MSKHLLTAAELAAFTNGVANLARAGAPLEKGLMLLGEDLQGAAGVAVGDINRQLESGGNLHEIIAADSRFPRSYSAVLEAGIRSGRLSAAMESVSRVLQRATELRRSMTAAMVYPLMVLLVAYGVALFVFGYWAPLMLEYSNDLTSTFSAARPFFRWLSSIAVYIAPVLPVVVAIALAVWWRRSSRSYFLPHTGLVTSGIQPAGRYAIFAEVLALLIECENPLPQALRLAGECTGDRFLAASSQDLAERIEQGENATADTGSSSAHPRGLPPMLRWLVLSSPQQHNIVATLRRSADEYHQRAALRSEWYSTRLPAYLTIGIGGSVATILALSVIGPWAFIMVKVGLPAGI